jgi:hypothetical protein
MCEQKNIKNTNIHIPQTLSMKYALFSSWLYCKRYKAEEEEEDDEEKVETTV